MNRKLRCALAAAAALTLSLTGCGGDDGPPQLAAATPAVRQACTTLASGFTFASTSITAASVVPAGSVTFAGQPVAEHCVVTGAMNQRTGVNGSYAIGFEMRLPTAWNGRFYYQANGGTDGSVLAATGTLSNASALKQGFAVISSDAGHTASQNPSFGIDPQARLDYGYQAVGKLTPMAKAMIATAYGKGPDRSYIGGCSNGGRHTMVAASRYTDQYDGYLVGDPGTVLPHAALANTAGAQAYAKFATNPADLSTGFTQAERLLVSKAVLAKCDALDGATDGLIQATKACQSAFDLNRDVPTCTGARDGTCLSAAQKTAIAGLFAGAKTSNGTLIYSSWPYDSGFATSGWAFWKFTVPLILDSGALGMIWQVPPADPATFNGANFALTSNIDTLYQAIHATNATYTEDSLSFMSPPHLEQVNTLRERGAKVMIYHGTSDPIFSSDHSVSVWERWNQTYAGVASNFARLFLVPGMNHCSGGPSTDQFDMLTPLVNWVEQGQAPDSVVASARGPGNAGGVNSDVPATWSPTRTRPLCPYPQTARLKTGATDLESAASFSCE
jgi:feruloyl esterase